MAMATISAKGWIVIPAEMRRRYGLAPGRQICIVDYGGVITLVPAMTDPIEESAGMLRGERSLATVLAAEHKVELERAG